MKKVLYISFPIIIILIIVLLFGPFNIFKKNHIFIAVAGPMTGIRKAEGRAMLNGAKLYLDKLNKAGGINGRKIKLLVFDDKAQIKATVNVASRIADDNRIKIVLGHFTSSSSIAAGRIYRKVGIPAITASATSDQVTARNDWYFRTIAKNSFMGSFIASYIARFGDKPAANIIYDTDSYGSTLVEHFEKTALELGLRINKKWSFDGESKSLGDEIIKIAAELRTLENPGIIFIACQGHVGAKIIATLKSLGSNYITFGPDTFTTSSFLKEFNKYPLEKTKPGYYSDSVYAISPLLIEVAGQGAHHFRRDYQNKYGEEPSWVAGCYYEAMHVAADAIEKAEIRGEGQPRRDRNEIREALMGMHSPEYAVEGLNGPIYFDKNGDNNGSLAVGKYERHQFLPSFTQFTLKTGPDTRSEETLSKVLRGDSIIVEDRVLDKTKVVYTGVDIKTISNLDVRNATYTMDFYIWFRYQGSFQPSKIRFPNALNPVELNEAIISIRKDQVTSQVFHVTADFRSNMNFHAFPFEEHILYIKFHHSLLKSSELIFVKDALGLPPSVAKGYGGGKTLNTIMGWPVKHVSYFHDIKSDAFTFGIPDYFDSQNNMKYSQFNAAVRIKRKEAGTAVRNFLPPLVMILGLFVFYFVPNDRVGIRLVLITGVLVSNVSFHVKLISTLPVDYITIMEYVFFSVYILIAIAMLLSVLIFTLERRGAVQKIKLFTRTGKLAHLLITLAAGLLIAYLYFMRQG